MRRFVVLGCAVVFSIAALTSCELFLGDDGKAYVRFTMDADADGGWTRLEGFPTTHAADTDYQLAEGSYDGEYVLYWQDGASDYDRFGNFDNYNLWYYTWTNDTNLTYVYYYEWWGYGDRSSQILPTQIDTYEESGAFDDYANPIDYSVTVEEGELFQDGEDRYFTLELTWDPGDFDVTSRNLTSGSARVVESTADRVVKELTDGAFTVRVEMRRSEAQQGPIRTPMEMK